MRIKRKEKNKLGFIFHAAQVNCYVIPIFSGNRIRLHLVFFFAIIKSYGCIFLFIIKNI